MTAAGRQRDFTRYVAPEIEVLLRVARTLTASTAEAEDLVQETVIRAWQALDRFDGRHPRAWLLTILRNTNKNMHRRRRPEVLAEPADHAQARPAFGPTVSSGPEEQHLDRVLDDDLDRAVQALAPQFRTVLVLVDLDDLSYAETARVLGVPIGTVMSRLSRARQRVRDHLLAHSSHLTSGGQR